MAFGTASHGLASSARTGDGDFLECSGQNLQFVDLDHGVHGKGRTCLSLAQPTADGHLLLPDKAVLNRPYLLAAVNSHWWNLHLIDEVVTVAATLERVLRPLCVHCCGTHTAGE
jgi:hypothetical protein